LIGEAAWEDFRERTQKINKATKALKEKTINPKTKEAKRIEAVTGEEIRKAKTAHELHPYTPQTQDRKSTRQNSSHDGVSRMPSSA
jgi:tRNA U34 5-carboxymethylaminomethyl modifying enzyme MnmG/GidA